MNIAYLLMGGNLGNREQYLQQANELIQLDCGKIIALSSIYETAPWGYSDQPSFYNQAMALQTGLSPSALMEQLLSIETKMGRIRSIKMGPRIIDLDILLMGDIICDTELIRLPHPSLPERKFALLPLAEIAGDLIHPVLLQSIATLLAHCKDELTVQKK